MTPVASAVKRSKRRILLYFQVMAERDQDMNKDLNRLMAYTIPKIPTIRSEVIVPHKPENKHRNDFNRTNTAERHRSSNYKDHRYRSSTVAKERVYLTSTDVQVNPSDIQGLLTDSTTQTENSLCNNVITKKPRKRVKKCYVCRGNHRSSECEIKKSATLLTKLNRRGEKEEQQFTVRPNTSITIPNNQEMHEGIMEYQDEEMDFDNPSKIQAIEETFENVDDLTFHVTFQEIEEFEKLINQ